MSLDGHVLCQRMLIGPVWAMAAGAATVAAAPAAAVARKRRREVCLSLVCLVIASLPVWPCRCGWPLIIGGKTKACAVFWQLDFAIMRPFDAALLLLISKSAAR